MYIGWWWKVGRVDGLTGLLFRGDAKLAQERGLAGLSLWFDRTSVLGGRGIGAGRDSAGWVFEFVGRMIYIQAGQSLTSRACSTVGGAN